MTITVRGRRRALPVELEWRDGELDGPDVIVALVNALVAAGTIVGAPGLERGPATLEPDEPELVAATMAEVLDHVASIEGLPPPEALGPGVYA